MNRHQALNSWLGGFCPAYVAGSVPDNAEPPYITYVDAWGALFDETTIPVTVWGDDGTAKQVNAIADAIAGQVSRGCIVKFDGGGMWLKPGAPFCYSSSNIGRGRRAVYINLNIETL